MTSLNLAIDGMSCGHCVMAVQKALHDVLDPHDLCNPDKIFPAST